MYYDPSGYAYQKDMVATIAGMTYADKVEALYKRRDEYYQGKKDSGALVYSDRGLLPGELDAVLYRTPKPSGDNITPHHMPSAESIKNNEGIGKNWGACTNTMEGTHTNTFTYGMSMSQRPYDTILYESLTYEDRLAFDQYDLVIIYAETRPNVDINFVESKLQDEYKLALEAEELNQMKQGKC